MGGGQLSLTGSHLLARRRSAEQLWRPAPRGGELASAQILMAVHPFITAPLFIYLLLPTADVHVYLGGGVTHADVRRGFLLFGENRVAAAAIKDAANGSRRVLLQTPRGYRTRPAPTTTETTWKSDGGAGEERLVATGDAANGWRFAGCQASESSGSA